MSKKLHILNLLLALPAIVSIVASARNGFKRSLDFQWSGAHLLANHIDPYLQQLRHDPEHLILAAQVPNYLQELYILLWPLGRLSFAHASIVWVVLNLGFALVSVWLVGKLFLLDAQRTILLGLLFFISTPFRIAIGNGQQCLLELALLVATLSLLVLPAVDSRTGSFWLGLSYFKYSFSPIFVFFLAAGRRWSLLVWSLLPATLGWLLFSYRVHRSPLFTALEPLLVSRNGVSLGDGDIATLLPLILHRAAAFALPLALLLSAVLGVYVSRLTMAIPHAFALMSVADLALLPHLTYDYVLLLLPAALLLSTTDWSKNNKLRWAAAALFTFWYVFKFVPTPRSTFGYELAIVVHMLLLAALWFTLLPSKSYNRQVSEGY